MKKVSVVMTTCNGTAYLHEQLSSIANQTLLPDELIVSDDASTDQTEALLSEFASSAPFPVTLNFNAVNVGYSRNFVSATDRASGDLILFADQDDIWSREKIASLCAWANSDTFDVITHDLDIFGEDVTPWRGSFFDYLETSGLRPAVCIKGCSMAVKASFLKTWGWPSSKCPITYDLWIGIISSLVGTRIYLKAPLVRHRIHGRNTSGWMPSRSGFQVIKTHESTSQYSDFELLLDLCIRGHNRLGCLDLEKILTDAESVVSNRNSLTAASAALQRHARWLTRSVQ